jgi:FolB domain-containing protein
MADLHLDRIYIRDLLVRCVIGASEEERREKQDINLNITLHADLRTAAKTDCLEDTVDYAEVKKKIVAMVEQSSFHLVEALADRVADVCLEDPRVYRAVVSVAKPGALRFARTVEIEITRDRLDT